MLDIFRTFIEQPIFNFLEVIYALIPGHDLGVAIIIFTALVRLALWPFVRKQLHHSRKIRALQPELKKIKKATKGDRQEEVRLQRELYKEHEIKPFSTIGTLIIQIPIFIGLYQAVLKLINDSSTLQTFSYSWVKELPWIEHVAASKDRFDASLFGIVDLSQKGLSGGKWYIPAVFLAAVAAYSQFIQSRHLLSDQGDGRKLRDILKDAAEGKETDQSEVAASVSKGMLFFMPFMTFIFSINLPSALSLYFLTSSVVGYFQQRIIMSEDIDEMSLVAGQESKKKNTDIDDAINDSPGGELSIVKDAGAALTAAAVNKKAKDSKVKTAKSGGVDLKITISSDSASKPANKQPSKNKAKKKRRR